MTRELEDAVVRVSTWLSRLPRAAYRGPGLRATPIAEIETLVAAYSTVLKPTLPAQGIDTRSAIDAQRRGPKGESPVANGDAPKGAS
jgi:hypothetical protein